MALGQCARSFVSAALFAAAACSLLSRGTLARTRQAGPCWWTDFDGHFNSEKGNFTLYWTFVTADTVMLQFELPGSAYIGLGFGGSMTGADMVIGWVYPNKTVFIGDYYAFGHEGPTLDTQLGGQNNVEALCGSFRDGRTVLRFQRRLNTSDKFDTVLTDDLNDLIYAWADGEPGDIHYHGDNHNHVLLSFEAPDGIPPNTFGQEASGLSARQLIQAASSGTLVTFQSDGAGSAAVSGYPYGSVAGIADMVPSTGQPYLLLSDIERNMRNFDANNTNCSLAVQLPFDNASSDAMMNPRATLLGTLQLVPDGELAEARTVYLAAHPFAAMWASFPDFHFYRFLVRDVSWVGGFGDEHFIGWVAAQAYLAHRL